LCACTSVKVFTKPKDDSRERPAFIIFKIKKEMDKSYFETRKTEIQSEIDSWKQELKDLEDEYISSNQKFPIGSKVCITTPAHTGMVLSTREKVTFPEAKRYSYVTGYEIRCKEVVPILMKAKKDGTISKIRDYITFERVIVELA
jgi:hypothetical protein